MDQGYKTAAAKTLHLLLPQLFICGYKSTFSVGVEIGVVNCNRSILEGSLKAVRFSRLLPAIAVLKTHSVKCAFLLYRRINLTLQLDPAQAYFVQYCLGLCQVKGRRRKTLHACLKLGIVFSNIFEHFFDVAMFEHFLTEE